MVSKQAKQVILYLTIGITGILAVGFSPLLLTELYEEGRLPLAFIGYVFTAELLGVGVGTTICRRVLGRSVGAAKVCGVLIALAGLNVASMFAANEMQLVIRFVAGLVGGLLVGLTIAVIVKSDRPTSVSAWFLTIQTAVQLVVALIIAEMLSPLYGSTGGFAALAVFALATLLPAIFVPPLELDGSTKQDEAEEGRGTAWPALACITAIMAALVCIVTYSEVHAASLDIAEEIAQLTIPIILLGQIVGGTTALVLSQSVSNRRAIPGTIILFLVILAGLVTTQDAMLVLLSYAMIGFCWMFIGPFFIGWLLEVDPSRSTAQLFAAAQLLGIAFGPTVGGLTAGSLNLAVGLSVATSLLGLILFIIVRRNAPGWATSTP